MPRPERDYVLELGIQLRLVGMDGPAIGSIQEEVRDHLDSSGQDPREAFGDPAEYAAELAEVHRDQLPARPFTPSAGDYLANAVQIVGFMLVLLGVPAAVLDGGAPVDLGPGHLAGAAVVLGGLAWPLWPAYRGWVARRCNVAVPFGAMLGVIAVSVALMTLWTEPVLAAVSPWIAIVSGLLIVAAFWVRTWRLRDPVRRPTDDPVEVREE